MTVVAEELSSNASSPSYAEQNRMDTGQGRYFLIPFPA